MHARRGSLVLILALAAGGCSEITQPPPAAESRVSAPGLQAAGTAATGEFAQTSISTLDVTPAGSNTIIRQTSEGVITGTIQGTFQDDLHVVIRKSGAFSTSFKITCQCEIGGQSGTLEFTATDVGEMVSPSTAVFSGRAVITGATDALAGTRGHLLIDGTVDLATGLSTYQYDGSIR